jgi:hypothetical protein
MSALMPAVDLEARTRARLTRLLRAERADKVEAVHAAELAAEARQSLRRSVVSVDVKWLEGLVETVAGGLYAQKLSALERGQFSRSDRLGDDIDALFLGLEKALRRGQIFGGRR